MSKDSYGIKKRFLEAIEYLKTSKGVSYRQVSLKIGANEFYVSKVRNDNQGVTYSSLSEMEKEYGISKDWIESGKGKMLAEDKKENTMRVVKNEHSEEEYEALRKERDSLKDKLLQQHEKYQMLADAYNKIKEELDSIKINRKQG